ncbi:17724_t:CDS:2, partial [Dentiscutata erythropus]
RKASSVLLQGAPLGIPIDTVRDKIQRVSGILSVHELHVWELSNAKNIASVHIRLLPSVDYMSLITNENNENNESSCLLRCKDDSCVQKLCCSTS